MRKILILSLLVLVVAVPALARPDVGSTGFAIDPTAVLRWEKGYRYPQEGWIVVHVEGDPYERGYQHGRLLAPEIVGFMRCYAQELNYKAPSEGWRTVRMFANALFLRKFDAEYLEEMKGIADGASAAGARFDGRPIDLVDIVVLNCNAEIDSLDQANFATPTGLESKIFPDPQPQAPPLPRGDHCSAFAATGPATADGKVVFGHITMWSLYAANFFNIWLDVQPTKGHRMVMCSYPGSIQSGMDYYVNSAGLLISETTIHQTKFDINGMTCASRIRKAIQYASTIDQAVEILLKENNGLYTNEWLLADINTNEVAMFELGTHKHKLWRSSKNEWFGGTPGFYWGCNNTKDLDVRLETIPSPHGKPANVVYRPESRDMAWQKVYQQHKGKIGVAFAKEAFTSSDIAFENASLDAKFTTTAMAKEMKSWAVFGPPTGTTWNPTKSEKEKYPDIKPLTTFPWTVLGTASPPANAGRKAPMLETPNVSAKKGKATMASASPAWRGTLLPASDGDIWLAVAFADYERYVANERASIKNGNAPDAAQASLEKSMTTMRKIYQNASVNHDVALADVKTSATDDAWYRLASSKGVLVLHALRTQVGSEKFDHAMDDFGMTNGGQRVTSKQFQAHMEQAIGQNLEPFFHAWLKTTGLPK